MVPKSLTHSRSVDGNGLRRLRCLDLVREWVEVDQRPVQTRKYDILLCNDVLNGLPPVGTILFNA